MGTKAELSAHPFLFFKVSSGHVAPSCLAPLLKWGTSWLASSALPPPSGSSLLNSPLSCHHEHPRSLYQRSDCGVEDWGKVLVAMVAPSPRAHVAAMVGAACRSPSRLWFCWQQPAAELNHPVQTTALRIWPVRGTGEPALTASQLSQGANERLTDHLLLF